MKKKTISFLLLSLLILSTSCSKKNSSTRPETTISTISITTKDIQNTKSTSTPSITATITTSQSTVASNSNKASESSTKVDNKKDTSSETVEQSESPFEVKRDIKIKREATTEDLIKVVKSFPENHTRVDQTLDGTRYFYSSDEGIYWGDKSDGNLLLFSEDKTYDFDGSKLSVSQMIAGQLTSIYGKYYDFHINEYEFPEKLNYIEYTNGLMMIQSKKVDKDTFNKISKDVRLSNLEGNKFVYSVLFDKKGVIGDRAEGYDSNGNLVSLNSSYFKDYGKTKLPSYLLDKIKAVKNH